MPSVRHDNGVGYEVARRGLSGNAGLRLFDLIEFCSAEKLNSASLKFTFKQSCRGGQVRSENIVGKLCYRDLRTEGSVSRGKLKAYYATTYDKQSCRQFPLRQSALAVGKRAV